MIATTMFRSDHGLGDQLLEALYEDRALVLAQSLNHRTKCFLSTPIYLRRHEMMSSSGQFGWSATVRISMAV